MALVVEDGTGLESAESYCSVADFRIYIDNRDLAVPDGTTDKEIEGALRRATEAIDALYGTSWAGTRLSALQGLDWGRAGVYVDSFLLPAGVLPKSLVHACCEGAWREVSAPGSLMPDVDSSGRVISESVGPISVTYASPGAAEQAAGPVVFKILDKLLGRLTTDGGGSGSIFFLRRA